MIRRPAVIIAAVAALLAFIVLRAEPAAPPAVAPPSDLAPVTSPRPRPSACAGVVTGNQALEDWRRSLGC